MGIALFVIALVSNIFIILIMRYGFITASRAEAA